MALRLVTSSCAVTAFCLQLACAACGSAGHSEEGSSSAGASPSGQALAVASCEACGEEAACNSHGVCTPTAWYCGPTYYNAGAADGCDCDCGVVDPDCELPGVEHWCYGQGQPYRVADCGSCQTPPA